jgi:hypothetical protein
MENSGLNALFAGRPADAIPPSAYDLWMLYRDVRQLKPKIIFEYGVGCSTYVMAEAARRNGAGRVINFEANEKWIEIAERDTPANLRNLITYRRDPIEVTAIDGDPCHRFVSDVDVVPDFIYLDGPNWNDVPGWPYRYAIAGNPAFLEPSLKPGFRMIVDARAENTAFLKRNLKRKYRIKYHDIFKVTTFDLLS